MVSADYTTEMNRLQDSKPKIKIEFIETDDTTTDISAYYLGGANFEQIKERAIDEIQAGSFDILLSNQDNNFSEYVSGSLLDGLQYHGARIRISLGFVLPDGTTEYAAQSTSFIDQIIANPTESIVTFRCRDIIQKLLDQMLHLRPSAEIPVMGASNIGNGTITAIETKPFKTVNENWTLTCTTGGGDGTGEFSVVGSVSGNVGTATSGTEFSTGTGAGGIKFKIDAGGTAWALNDAITFTTSQYPEWSNLNPAKIVWSILTGYNYDTDTQENFSGLILDLDRTQGAGNADIDYASFAQAISDLDDLTSSLNLKGYVGYDENASEFLQNLISIFVGSLYTDGDGKLVLQTWVPVFGTVSSSLPSFTDALKISALGYIRTVDEIINYVSTKFKRTDSWEFSDDTVIYDGAYVASDSDSITKYGKYALSVKYRFYNSTGSFAENMAKRVVLRFAEPPLNIDFETGLDGVTQEIGNRIRVTDTKYGFSGLAGEVASVNKMFDAQPKKIKLRIRRDADSDTEWGFLGSSGNEGDGLSPQELSWDDADEDDKRFCYLSQNGGGTFAYLMF